MSAIKLHYEIDGTDFTRAGEASASVKKTLRQLGVRPRRNPEGRNRAV